MRHLRGFQGLMFLPMLLLSLTGKAQNVVASVSVQKIDLSKLTPGVSSYSFDQIVTGGNNFLIQLLNVPAKDSAVATVLYADNAEKFDPKKTYSLKNMPYLKIRVILVDTLSKKGTDTVDVKFIREPDNGDTSLHNSSFVSASFVKSIAGTNIPSNELLDLFIKVNFGPQKRYFALMGADAGLGASSQSDTIANKGSFRLNEAMANFNYAIFRQNRVKLPSNCNDVFKNTGSSGDFDKANAAFNSCMEKKDSLANVNATYFDNKLKRTGFLGVGLKVFYKEAYIGGHIGVIETNGSLFGSYILCGFYHNTYAGKVTKDSTAFNYYSNNIYFEAGLNIFAGNSNTNLSTFFNSIRFKFGLMLPMKSKGDLVTPQSKDIISRLTIEIPLGIKRF